MSTAPASAAEIKPAKKPPSLRNILDLIVVTICVGTFSVMACAVIAALLGPSASGTRDFVEYWAAGQQLAHRADPYNADAILALERTAGYPAGMTAQVMANPPSVLLLVLPLGFLGSKTGELIWILLLLASLAASVQMIRALHGNPKNLLHLIAYAFAPALSCLLAGQISLFILLGLVLFLRLHRTRPFLAGASLWLCLLKPHLFLPFGVALLVWIAITRSYRIAAGTVTALGLSSAVATLINPAIWTQYSAAMRVMRVDKLPLPGLSTMLREWVYPHTAWVQCLPAAIGCLWAIYYLVKRRNQWDWVTDGSILMLVSVLVTPYSWFMDQAVLIPALLHGAYQTRSRPYIAILALLSAFIQIAQIRGVVLYSNFYLWTAPAWLIWYLLATRKVAGEAFDPAVAADQAALGIGATQ